jgi:transposase-like protein
LKGFPHAITTVFPETVVQTCIVHLMRYSMQFASWKEREALAAALRPVYRADTAEAAAHEFDAFDAGPWGAKYPAVAQSWRRNWEAVIPFFAFPAEVRKIIYTTNAIESLNASVRKAVRNKGHFPTDQAAKIDLAGTAIHRRRMEETTDRMACCQGAVRDPVRRALRHRSMTSSTGLHTRFLTHPPQRFNPRSNL